MGGPGGSAATQRSEVPRDDGAGRVEPGRGVGEVLTRRGGPSALMSQRMIVWSVAARDDPAAARLHLHAQHVPGVSGESLRPDQRPSRGSTSQRKTSPPNPAVTAQVPSGASAMSRTGAWRTSSCWAVLPPQ